MINVSQLGLADQELADQIDQELRRIVAVLPEDASCLVTGSIVAGLGNANSDIDVYAVHGTTAPADAVALGMRASRYVDCEYMTLGSLENLADEMARHDWRALLDMPLAVLDRYYRVCIALPAQLGPGAKEVLARFDPEPACRALADWSLLTAYGLHARATGLLAVGLRREAGVVLRHAAQWRATGVLATAGEGYASAKWTAEKAARVHGRGTEQYHALVDDFLRPAGTVEDLAERLRAALVLPPEPAALLAARRCALAPKVRLVAGPDADLMVRGRAQIAEVSGLARAVCRELAGGADWTAAAEAVGAALALPSAEVAAAAWHETRRLRTAGFLLED